MKKNNLFVTATKNSIDILEKINRRQNQILLHSCIYYKFGTSIISDAQFDDWSKELVKLRKENPEIAKQSRLESEALGYRKETLIINDYQKETGKEYSAEHEDAKSHDDELHPLGKGTGNGGHGYSVPNPNASKTQIKPQLLRMALI